MMNRCFGMTSNRAAVAILLCCTALWVAGCSSNQFVGPDTTPISGPQISGTAQGGNQPIIGATVKIYATTNSGYGVGTLLQEATQQGVSSGQDTDNNGRFSFAGGYNCPAGQFVYVVSSGGNTGANAVNPSAVLVAALGRCEDLYTNNSGTYTGYTGSPIDVDELTTIAAAYALGNFASTSGTGAATVVGIGASATNNAAKGSGVSTGCVAGVGSCVTTAAAGLAHAFLNAANLVNVYSFPATAYANPPSDSTAVAPQAVLNSIGNSLVACVNSDGTAAACSSIFTATTLNSVTPTNTFQAMVNLAANPTFSGSAAAAANFWGYATPQTSVYSPALTSATGLNDLTLAINYPVGLGAVTGTQGLTFPTSGALDINDVYYVGNESSTSGAVPVNLLAFASNGTLLSATPNGVTLKSALGLSVDALGNGYFVNGSNSASNALGVFTTNGGILSQYTIKAVGSLKAYQTAVDRNNNVWVLDAGTSGNTLFESPAGAGSFTGQAAVSIAPASNSQAGLAIDPDQNVWMTASTVLAVLQNTGTTGTPAYSSTTLTATPSGSPATGIAFAPGSPYVAYVSSYNTTAGIQPFTPTIVAPEVTGITPGTLTTGSSEITGTYYNEADGAGNIWLADTNSHSVIQFTPGTPGTAYRYEPCLYVVANGGCFTGTTTQSSLFTTGKPFTVSVDSTGSIWVTAQAGGNVVQIIGAAAPTWPLLSLGTTGKP